MLPPAWAAGCASPTARRKPSRLLRDPAKGEPLEIQKLIAHAAQLT